jgi:hypothetical protein
MRINKWFYALLSLPLMLPAGLFGAPAAWVSAETPIYRYVSIGWVLPPAEKVCVDDPIPIIFVYVVMDYYQARGGGVTAVPSDDPGDTILTAFTTGTGGLGGTISPNKWSLRYAQSSGRINATYKATKTGTERLTISGTGVLPEGASTDFFQVVNCSYDLAIGASAYEDKGTIKIVTALSGKAIIEVDENGLVMGEGTYKYSIGIDYTPPETIKCDPLTESVNDSTFTVSGTASVTTITMQIKFYPIEIKPIDARCTDREGKEIYKQVFPGGTVDVNSQLELPAFSMPTSQKQYRDTFQFGTSWGRLFILKRTGK